VIEAEGTLDDAIEKTILSAINNEHEITAVCVIPLNEILTYVYEFEDYVV
jgi:hypothetical protein